MPRAAMQVVCTPRRSSWQEPLDPGSPTRKRAIFSGARKLLAARRKAEGVTGGIRPCESPRVKLLRVAGSILHACKKVGSLARICAILHEYGNDFRTRQAALALAKALLAAEAQDEAIAQAEDREEGAQERGEGKAAMQAGIENSKVFRLARQLTMMSNDIKRLSTDAGGSVLDISGVMSGIEAARARFQSSQQELEEMYGRMHETTEMAEKYVSEFAQKPSAKKRQKTSSRPNFQRLVRKVSVSGAFRLTKAASSSDNAEIDEDMIPEEVIEEEDQVEAEEVEVEEVEEEMLAEIAVNDQRAAALAKAMKMAVTMATAQDTSFEQRKSVDAGPPSEVKIFLRMPVIRLQQEENFWQRQDIGRASLAEPRGSLKKSLHISLPLIPQDLPQLAQPVRRVLIATLPTFRKMLPRVSPAVQQMPPPASRFQPEAGKALHRHNLRSQCLAGVETLGDRYRWALLQRNITPLP
mmetsp:Transcript_5994/g.11248  ORF Transcript_5994/g.11248 Transcript_5994/m.11248 type:complete len:468 (-) Transcript_5994:80-1483(-)